MQLKIRSKGLTNGNRVFSHMEVIDTGGEPEQKLTGDFVLRGLVLGYVSMPDADATTLEQIKLVPMGGQWPAITSGRLILHAEPEDLVYTIRRGPGRWCAHCDEKLYDETKADRANGKKLGDAARAHVAALHSGKVSPDPENPSGYMWRDSFDCILDAKQHAKFSVKGN